VKSLASLFCIVVATSIATAQSYQQPPEEIRKIVDAPAPAEAFMSPNGEAVLLATPVKYRPISDLAEPVVRGAGTRINPNNNASHLFPYYIALALCHLPDGRVTAIQLPTNARVTNIRWNSSGSSFAFANVTSTSVELWIVDMASGRSRRIEGVRLNTVLGYPLEWMPDQTRLIVKTVPDNRGEAPAEVVIPTGPRVEESSGVKSASSTYENVEVLRTPRDRDLFEYYGTSRLAFVDVSENAIHPIGTPAVIWQLKPSPDGRYLLVEKIERPYSSSRMFNRFPTRVEVWDIAGTKIETIANLPLAEQVPIEGVRVGPRAYNWRATAPATVTWVEALDNGDTFKKVPYHDRVMIKPVGGVAAELVRLKDRFSRLDWIDQGGVALVTEEDLENQITKTSLVNAADPTAAARLVWSVGSDDAYHDPGEPVFRLLPGGARAIQVIDDAIFMTGEGASPKGSRPFLDRLNLRTLSSDRLFRSSPDQYEQFVGFVDARKPTFVTRRESSLDPPNLVLRTLGGTNANIEDGEPRYASSPRQLTHFDDPAAPLRKLTKRIVTYERADGVKLFFTLYLPPGYKEGTRLPTIISAYPLDYADANSAGQVTASSQRFTMLWGASPLYLALQGYAVLDDAAMPIVGAAKNGYDTMIEQTIANAKAAIDKAVAIGVADRDRVGVIGHSHGALMVANLLAWSDLFRAGVASSGAYNHTLRPFGYQFERRTLFQVPDSYLKNSPLLHADRINEPLLLIHGELDNNPATVPLQSEKMYEAIRGTGGTARLVMLPLEIHGYLARESVQHVLYEMIGWFDKYLKNPR
jgi:dipeptidyl aminopeptidase/acylaminoacyl peptidase